MAKLELLSNTRFKRFFLLNFFTISAINFVLLFLYNGSMENSYPWMAYNKMLLFTALMVAGQYPILNFRRNWLYKTGIFYLSMIVFLFLVGISFEVGETQNQASFLECLNGGWLMVIAGQIFGGLLVFPGILLLNWLARKKTFCKD